jgi:2-oxo-4-hydroxy-4-carboxy--5-ureidoimidazoline (OHCU) decarboxylase
VTAITRDDLRAVFERAPGLADRVSGDDAASIIASARAELGRMTDREKAAVLDAHPRIGAGEASLSALSRVEQSDPADASTLAELARMNEEYERRHGFRFVVFVNGRPKSAIVPLMRERLRRGRDEELATGLAEYLAIAEDRLRKVRS